MFTWDGSLVTDTGLLDRMVVLDREFTKSTGVQCDGKNTIWLVNIDGQKAILKRSPVFYRNQRTQIFLDEIKPSFGLAKIGCVLVAPPRQVPTLLMRFVGGGLSLQSFELEDWLFHPKVADILLRIALYDMTVSNSSRKGRNILCEAPGVLVPIDEEQALDFAINPEFRMSGAVRRRMIMQPVAELAAHLKRQSERFQHEWYDIATRYYRAKDAEELVRRLIANLADCERRYFTYLGSHYGDATHRGVKARSVRGPASWELEPYEVLQKAR